MKYLIIVLKILKINYHYVELLQFKANLIILYIFRI